MVTYHLDIEIAMIISRLHLCVYAYDTHNSLNILHEAIYLKWPHMALMVYAYPNIGKANLYGNAFESEI